MREALNYGSIITVIVLVELIAFSKIFDFSVNMTLMVGGIGVSLIVLLVNNLFNIDRGNNEDAFGE